MTVGRGRPGSPALVLASSSPRRRRILELLGLAFEVRPASPEVEGSWDGAEPPSAFARRAASAKAAEIADGRADALVVAADTIVVLDGTVLGKPADEAEARATLARLAGREHVVHTGVAVVAPARGVSPRREASGVEATAVRFRPLTEEDVEAYVATGEPLDKAGAYGIQGHGAALVQEVRGCFFNVMGLPVARLLTLLEEAGWRYAFPGVLRPV